MKNNIIYGWDKNNGIASCIIHNGDKFYTGTARCHPDDNDMLSEKTGCEIAFHRAKINLLREYRNEIKIKLNALNQLYYSMNMSKNFNEKSYEYKMLKRQINMYTFDLETIKEDIENEQQKLRKYLADKDKFYNHIRANRQKDNNN